MSKEKLFTECFERLEREAGESAASLRHRLRKIVVEFVEVSAGEIKVKMSQGKQKPVFVKMTLDVLPEPLWEKITGLMSREAGWAAALSFGSLPPDFEKVFKREGARLLPESLNAFKVQCSADPEPSGLCRHAFLAWLLFLLELERKPLRILDLRGRRAEELLERLKESQTLKKPGGFPLAETGDEPAPGQPGWPGTAAWARGLPPEKDLWFEKLPPSGWLWKGQDLRAGLLCLIENARLQASRTLKDASPDGTKTGEVSAPNDGILPE